MGYELIRKGSGTDYEYTYLKLMAEKERYFSNPWLKESCCQSKQTITKEDPLEILCHLRPQIISVIDEELPTIDQEYEHHKDNQSIYTGSAGAAFLHFHLANTLYKTDSERRQHELSLCLKLLEPSLIHLKTHRITFLCGAAGPLALAAVVYLQLGQQTNASTCIEKLKTLHADHTKTKYLPSELLYGHTGYLYALLFVNAFNPGSIENSLIEEICSLIICTGQAGSEPRISSPLMYTWHDKHYLGAAHGVAGIMAVLLQAIQYDVVSRHLDMIRATVDYLLSLQLPSGNFPSSLESISKDRLVQWCHGAPGFVHMFALAHRVFGDNKYLVAAEQCGDVVWQRGLLLKGYGLCHGVAGNGYAFLQLYRLTSHVYHLHRAIKFCEWCLTSSERHCSIADAPFSLFEGLAGKLIFIADFCNDISVSRFPALELPSLHNI